MDKDKIKSFLKSFLIWFIIFYLILLGFEKFFGQEEKEINQSSESIISVSPVVDSVVIGNLTKFVIENKSENKMFFDSPCEKEGTLEVLYVGKHEETAVSENIFDDCAGKSISSFALEPGEIIEEFDIRDFSQEIFNEEGIYKLKMIFSFGENEEKIVNSTSFEVEKPGAIRQLFRALISKPLFNILVFLTNTLPGKTFGWAIVILTILVRLALFIPNQKAMRSQRELQKLQPKIEEIKRKHGKNQQLVAMETMALYKAHKVNPMGSCLPMLFQMPFLLGIFYILRNGISPHLDYLLYGFQSNIDLAHLGTNMEFFGLDLASKGTWILAILVGVAQWGAITLSMITAKKKIKKENNAPVKHDPKSTAGQMQQMNKIMKWGMPVMVGFFVTSFPAGVGIYWFTSTLFGVVQQKYVNWKMDKPQIVRKEG